MGLVQAEDAIDSSSFSFFFFLFLFSTFFCFFDLCSNPTKALMGLYKIMNHGEGEAFIFVAYI